MTTADPTHFHKLYGVKRPRTTYRGKDFFDYTLMTVICGVALYFIYGPTHVLSWVTIALCVYMIVAFALRHGVEAAVPLLLRRPQDALYMIVYKIQNIKPVYFFAVAVLLLENYIIRITPDLPHHVGLMRNIALWLFYIHLGGITIYRTVILVAHLRERVLVRDFLMETSWKKAFSRRDNVVLEIFHAYFTGLLAHIVTLAPWYLIITHFEFSVLALPLALVLNVFTESWYLKVVNDWFYRDHWLGHNSELEFIYLHGTHHDAIPSGLIAVAGNGHLEGFVRYLIAFPTFFLNPIATFAFLTLIVQKDIATHQYIPGVYPKLGRKYLEKAQHATHHMGQLEPYSFGLKKELPGEAPAPVKKSAAAIPDELMNSIGLDEHLTGFQWDNESHRKYMRLFDKYSKASEEESDSPSLESEPPPIQ
ncbi:hypothetical protein [Lysobacter hankyongensis]|uniref:Fatty acid hydroxylase domain-containing protein n=1 Tax=Lysobacter hankyongensis TaxID=1176535 RepID=A0ABP9BZI0_9GAMM